MAGADRGPESPYEDGAQPELGGENRRPRRGAGDQSGAEPVSTVEPDDEHVRPVEEDLPTMDVARRVHGADLTATRELLTEIGYSGISIDAVAARAGVGKPTVYRRYSNKTALVFEAVFGKTKAQTDPDTGSLASDLREAYRWAVEEFAAPAARAALPGLIADLAANPQLAELVRTQVIGPEYARVRAALERARERGDHAFGDRLVDLIINGLAPRPYDRG